MGSDSDDAVGCSRLSSSRPSSSSGNIVHKYLQHFVPSGNPELPSVNKRQKKQLSPLQHEQRRESECVRERCLCVCVCNTAGLFAISHSRSCADRLEVLVSRESSYPLHKANGPASRGIPVCMLPLPDKLKNSLQEHEKGYFKRRGISPQDPKVFLTVKR